MAIGDCLLPIVFSNCNQNAFWRCFALWPLVKKKKDFNNCKLDWWRAKVCMLDLHARSQWQKYQDLQTTYNTELAIHALGQVHCLTTILEPKLGFVKILTPSIFSHECSPNYDASYITYVLPFHRWATQSYTQ
jgi:hypothetical protein